ncbi:unnamed protein product [Timema podura]|uniref:Uncharacterized protein n=1 Tax=Timema podura TaxID=61482 RepID=A0ABN7PCS9_TIMPD|nr:unnamed protein product [Timema podura]
MAAGDREVCILVTFEEDIKDVVLFQVLSPLPARFIDFFHTNTVDRFLRALIVYVQYFLQVYDEILLRNRENLHKLHHPNILKIENKMQETLSELRGMVGREYTSILLGCDEVKKFHHMANRMNTSQGEQDVRLFELLYRMCTRIVWIALQRRYLNLIELELNRLFRTDEFNVVKHQKGQRKSFVALDRQDFVHTKSILSWRY